MFKTPLPMHLQHPNHHHEIGMTTAAAVSVDSSSPPHMNVAMHKFATRVLDQFHQSIVTSRIDQRVRGDTVLLPFAIPDIIGITPAHMHIYSDLANNTIDELYASSDFDDTILLARAMLYWAVLGPDSATATSTASTSVPLLLSLSEQIATVAAHFACFFNPLSEKPLRALQSEIARMDWRMINAMIQVRQVEMEDAAVDEEARASVQKMPYLLDSHAATVRIALCKFNQSAAHRRKHARFVKCIYAKLMSPIANCSGGGGGGGCSEEDAVDEERRGSAVAVAAAAPATSTIRLETPTNRWLVLDANVVFRPKH